MNEMYVGEIRVFANNFIPVGWLSCDGTFQPAAKYQDLYNVIGTIYGGDSTNFALPNLNSRAAMRAGTSPVGTNYQLGGLYGEASVILTEANLPVHTHQLTKKNTDAGNSGKVAFPTLSTDLGGLSAANGSVGYKSGSTPATPNATLHPRTITHTGESQPHENRQPYLAMYFAIAWQGIVSP